MANQLAHEINNPLQSLTNLLCEAEQARKVSDKRSLSTKQDGNFRRRSGLLKGLLELPPARAITRWAVSRFGALGAGES